MKKANLINLILGVFKAYALLCMGFLLALTIEYGFTLTDLISVILCALVFVCIKAKEEIEKEEAI